MTDHDRRHAGPAPSPGTRSTPTPRSSARRSRPSGGLSGAEVETRRAEYGPNKFADAPKEPRWQAFLRQYKDPMQIVLLVAGILSLFIPGQVADRRRAHRPDAAQRRDGPEPGRQGLGERGRPPEDDGRQGEGPPRRGARRGADGGARPGRHRQHRGRRPRPGRRPDPDRGDARDRRVGADRRERPGAQAGRRGGGRRRPRRPGRPRVHEHPGDPRRGHDPGASDRDGDRGRPHQRHAPGDQGRGHAAHQAAQHADQPDPDHRRRLAGRSRSASACGATRRSTSCS